MNLDDVDYLANAMEKDEALSEVQQEIKVLMQLKDHGVQNVNLIHDVLEVDGLLWLICEYCPGGSLRTLVSVTHSLFERLCQLSTAWKLHTRNCGSIFRRGQLMLTTLSCVPLTTDAMKNTFEPLLASWPLH